MLKSNRLDDRPGIRPDVILCDLPYPCCREPGVGNARLSPARAAGAATALDTSRAFLGRCGWPDLDQADPRGFESLSALDNIDDYGLSLVESGNTRTLQSRDVHEHVLAAAVPSDEAVALLGVEPLYRAGLLDRHFRRWPVRCRGAKARSARRCRNSGARIDTQHLGDVWPFVAGADTNFEGFPWLHGADPVRGQHASVEEGIA